MSLSLLLHCPKENGKESSLSAGTAVSHTKRQSRPFVGLRPLSVEKETPVSGPRSPMGNEKMVPVSGPSSFVINEKEVLVSGSCAFINN